MGRSPACQEGLFQLEGSKIPHEESVARFTLKEREGAQLPQLSKGVLSSWGTWQEWEANSIGCHEDKRRPLRSQSGFAGHWNRSRMGRRNIINQEAVRTEAGKRKSCGKQQNLSPSVCC